MAELGNREIRVDTRTLKNKLLCGLDGQEKTKIESINGEFRMVETEKKRANMGRITQKKIRKITWRVQKKGKKDHRGVEVEQRRGGRTIHTRQGKAHRVLKITAHPRQREVNLKKMTWRSQPSRGKGGKKGCQQFVVPERNI